MHGGSCSYILDQTLIRMDIKAMRVGAKNLELVGSSNFQEDWIDGQIIQFSHYILKDGFDHIITIQNSTVGVSWNMQQTCLVKSWVGRFCITCNILLCCSKKPREEEAVTKLLSTLMTLWWSSGEQKIFEQESRSKQLFFFGMPKILCHKFVMPFCSCEFVL